jgi:hypothetical protein
MLLGEEVEAAECRTLAGPPLQHNTKTPNQQWYLILREGNNLQVSENKVQRTAFGCKAIYTIKNFVVYTGQPARASCNVVS